MIGDLHVLLGADLEEPGSSDLGWSAILSNTTLPRNLRADLFKIPHHGSATAHHPDVWTRLTTGKPVTATTPWRVAGSVLPRKVDVDRIVDLSRLSYVTKENLYQPAVRRTNMVRKLTPTSLRRLQRTPGQLRFRKKLGEASEWRIELFDGAAELKDFRTLS
jgi:hypothetical protein